MYLEGVVEARAVMDAVGATLHKYQIPGTPDNYVIWYEYYTGHDPELTRTIDVIVSNNAAFDESTLRDLYSSFFSSAKEEAAIRETSALLQRTLADVIGIADRARSDADDFGAALSVVASADFGTSVGSLRDLIKNLVRETQRMVGRSHFVGACMRESADKIRALESNLEKAVRDSTTDALTGIANRKVFDTMIRRLAGEAMNSGENLALLMIDIDHFKCVNDTWGHQVGDVVLCHVAETLRRSVGSEDCLARYGGEEFALILPNTDSSAAGLAAENIRSSVAAAPLWLDITPKIKNVTVSVGVSCYEPGDPLVEWVGRTDAALYRAKKEGRNRVQLA
jgi:diguanylate cyclase